MVLIYEFFCHLDPVLGGLLQKLLDFGECLGFWIIVLFCLGKVDFDVLGGLKIFEVFDEFGVVFKHPKFDDVMDQVSGVDHGQQLLRLDTASLKFAQDELGRIGSLLALFVFGENEGHEEEPDTVREENIGFGSHEDQVDEVIGVVHVTLNVDAA